MKFMALQTGCLIVVTQVINILSTNHVSATGMHKSLALALCFTNIEGFEMNKVRLRDS